MAELSSLVQRLEVVTNKLEQLTQAKISSSSSSSTSTAKSVEVFQSFLSSHLSVYLAKSKELDALVGSQATHVEVCFQTLCSIIQSSTTCKKPSNAQLVELTKPLTLAITEINKFKDENRKSPFYFHLSTVSEGIACLSWIFIEPAPAQYVMEMKDAAKFYADKILKEWRGKDEKHVEWSNTFISMLVELHAYVKQYHTTGLAWNVKGKDAETVSVKEHVAVPKPVSAGNNASLLGAIGKGEAVTSGLRKVEKSEMTHKNPNLRATSVVKAVEKEVKSVNAPYKPSKLALEGNKWVVEHHVDNKNIVIVQTDIRQVVYVYGCRDSVIQIKGKVNAVTVDACSKVGLVLDSVVSTIELVHSKSTQVQVNGTSPTVSVDQCDSVQLFLGDFKGTHVLTAKSHEVNVNIQKNGDWEERPIPEMIKTVIRENGQIVSSVVEHA